MKSDKIKKFMNLAGHSTAIEPENASPELKKLAASLVLSETLEYVIRGLGIELKLGEQVISDPEMLEYHAQDDDPDKKEMLDGLADIAYTMYWNMHAFGLALEEAFELVCDNNLEKFKKMENWKEAARPLESEEWGLGQNVEWPAEVVTVEVIEVGSEFYAVGKDANGKVRKPSTYKSVNLEPLL